METSSLAQRLSTRFVAGETLDQALAVARKLNAEGITVTLDHLGESVSTLAEAAEARDVYLRTLDAIHENGIQGNVSLKLTQFGLDLSYDQCLANVEQLVRRAAELGSFVRVDMESSDYTDRTLDLVHTLHARYGAVGVVIQSYLYRSQADIEKLCAAKIGVRLCKGAYLEPAAVAFPRKADVDRSYLELTRYLLENGVYPALATHDEADHPPDLPVRHRAQDLRATASNFRCSTASAATCSAAWWPRATACASMSRSARPGTPTTCVVSPNVRPMCSSCCETCYADVRNPPRCATPCVIGPKLKVDRESLTGMRYWAWFVAKLAVAGVVLRGILLKLDLPDASRRIRIHWPLRITACAYLLCDLALMLCFLVFAGVLYLIVWDQRYRCRVCLRRLRMPIATGSWSRILQFGRPRIEYICPYGHGTLSEDDLHISGLSGARVDSALRRYLGRTLRPR